VPANPPEPVPLLTRAAAEVLRRARDAGASRCRLTLDLGRSEVEVALEAAGWRLAERLYPFPERLRERTIYHWDGADYRAVSRYGRALVKLVPTEWGAPTFEIDGIKMLPTARQSPVDDARAKVALIEPRGRRVLDTCAGLGYFAAEALAGGAARVRSYEKSPDVLWLRGLNPWSPVPQAALELVHDDVTEAIRAVPDGAFEAALHDPPRFGIAGELYSAAFYAELYRVLCRGARLFHYTGTPNRLSSGRDVPGEVATRLAAAGFGTSRALDGVLAVRR
jgi:uncharacterized protein